MGKLIETCGLLLLTALLGCSDSSQGEVQPAQSPPHAMDRQPFEATWSETPQVLRATEPWFGDLPEIRERGVLRVLVSYSRTHFFLAEGELRGFEYELFRELEKYLEKERKKGQRPFQIAFLPLPFAELLPALRAGRGDVAAAALTITPERQLGVAFTEPYLTGVDEVLVAYSGAARVTSWDDLAGRAVHVAPGTSFAEHLHGISEDLVTRGLAPLEVRTDGRGLSTEDMLELVSSGALEYTVADRFVVELWSELLTGLRIEEGLSTARDGSVAWAVRQDAPQLAEALSRWAHANRQGTLIGNVLFKRYFEGTKWIKNPRLDIEAGKIHPYLAALERISGEYGFDWRVIASQAYQESGFDAEATSGAGAIGLMQLLPSTAKDMQVSDLHDPEQNILAGVRYMAWLREHYFSDPRIAPVDATDLALAAYNSGPGRVRRWREAAPARGLDPNRWFGHVESLALEDVGLEPVRYVANINKYALIFTLMLDELATKQAELEPLRTTAPR